MLKITIDHNYTSIELKTASKADYLTDFANVVAGLAHAIGKTSGEDETKIIQEFGDLLLAMTEDDEPPFHIDNVVYWDTDSIIKSEE